jgi:hypothetical protein
MWKLYPEADGFSRTENAARIKQRLSSLPDKIPQIKYFQVGLNQNISDQACDLVLYSHFENHKDLQTYLQHPEHLKFKDFSKTLRSRIYVVDFEI